MEKKLEDYIISIQSGYEQEPDNSLGDPQFGWEHEINDFVLDIDGTHITLEPVVYTISQKKIILLEIWTELFDWFPEPGTHDAYNFIKRLEDQEFLQNFIEETSAYHTYGDRPKQEIVTIYKLWEFGSSGQIILDEELKEKAIEKLSNRLSQWTIMMLQDFEPYLDLTELKTRTDYKQDLGF